MNRIYLRQVTLPAGAMPIGRGNGSVAKEEHAEIYLEDHYVWIFPKNAAGDERLYHSSSCDEMRPSKVQNPTKSVAKESK